MCVLVNAGWGREKPQVSAENEREGWKDCKMGKKREACRFGAHVMNACWDNRCVVMSFSVCVCVCVCVYGEEQ